MQIESYMGKTKCDCQNKKPYQIGLSIYAGFSIEWWNCDVCNGTFIEKREILPSDEEWRINYKQKDENERSKPV